MRTCIKILHTKSLCRGLVFQTSQGGIRSYISSRSFSVFTSNTRQSSSNYNARNVRFLSSLKGDKNGITIYQQDALDTPEKLSKTASMSISDTSLWKEGSFLMDGLDIYSVPALGDHHPLSVYGLDSLSPAPPSSWKRPPILLLHGRTWSSLPVYHLLGGDLSKDPSKNPLIKSTDEIHESRSLMESLYDLGLQPYTMDFRGFGGTPCDSTGYVEPHRCVRDTVTVLSWIANRHGIEVDTSVESSSVSLTPLPKKNSNMPALFGWSQGALVAQLAAQQHPSMMSKLVLYGSIYDPMVRYPREALYKVNEPNQEKRPNTYNDAIEDFTIENTIPQEPARMFAEAALVTDPIKAVWKHLYQFNNCDPARVNVPTLVIGGDQDPYAPLHVQQELFLNLGRGSDRTWSILSDADHAGHVLDDAKDRFANIVTSFVINGKRDEWLRTP